jgi:hypothetical protein
MGWRVVGSALLGGKVVVVWVLCVWTFSLSLSLPLSLFLRSGVRWKVSGQMK